MNLNEEEKFKISQEEKQHNETDKTSADLTEKEKQKRLDEMYKKNVYINKKNLWLPNKQHKIISIIIFAIIFTILFICFGVGIAIKCSIAFFIIYFILGVATLITIFPLIKYSCPFCRTKESNSIRNEQKKEQRETGYIKAYCCNCERYYKLIVTKDVLEHF